MLLEADAAKCAEHVQRVLHDAARAQEQEDAALQHAFQAAEQARVLTGVKMSEQWAALVQSPEWKEAAQGMPGLERALLQTAAQMGSSGGVGGEIEGREGGKTPAELHGTWRGDFEV